MEIAIGENPRKILLSDAISQKKLFYGDVFFWSVQYYMYVEDPVRSANECLAVNMQSGRVVVFNKGSPVSIRLINHATLVVDAI